MFVSYMCVYMYMYIILITKHYNRIIIAEYNICGFFRKTRGISTVMSTSDKFEIKR